MAGFLAASPPANGRVLAGIAAMFGSIDYPFIDITKLSGSTWQVLGPSQDPYLLMNSDGYPNSHAAGDWRLLVNGLLQDTADGFSGRWVLDWTTSSGSATLNLGGAGLTISQASSGAGFIIYNVTAALPAFSPINLQVNITACTGQITSIRLYPQRLQTVLNGGQIWDPDFIDFYKVYGRVRFMDWIGTNSSSQFKWVDRPKPTWGNLRGYVVNQSAYAGGVTQSKNDFTGIQAISGNPSSWTDGMQMQAWMHGGTNFATISSGTYDNTTGVIVLTMSSPIIVAVGRNITLSGLTGTGAFSSLNGLFNVTANTSGTTITCTTSAGKGVSTITGGTAGATFSTVNYQSVTLSATTTVNATGHPFVNGDFVQFENQGGGNSFTGHTTEYAPFYTVSNVVAGVSFDLSVNSTTWSGGVGSGICFYAMRFKSGLLPFKVCCSADGNALFSGNFTSIGTGDGGVVILTYDADFDRLIIGHGPDGQGLGGSMGCPIETLVDLANKLGPLVQPWFNIPHQADTDFVTNWATYIRDNLNPQIRFCAELSNEVWNTAVGFIQTQWAQNKGALRWGESPLNNTDAGFQYYGYRFRIAMQQIETVFSGQMNRVNRVFGHQAISGTFPGLNSQVTHRMECPHEGFTVGDYPINHADSMCYAPYYNYERGTAFPAQHVWNVVYSGDSTLIASGLAYIDFRMRADTTGQGSMYYYAGATRPPFPVKGGQNWVWNQVIKAYTSTLSGKAIEVNAYEGGWNNFSNAGSMSGATPYTPPSVTVVSGTYNSGTGLVVLTLSNQLTTAAGGSVTVSALTGTGAFASLNGTFTTVATTGGTTVSYTAATGLGVTTVTGGSIGLTLTSTDFFNYHIAYQDSALYATFLTDASNQFIEAGGIFPAQYCVVNGTRSAGNMFAMLAPNRLAPATPPYTAWRTLNGR